MDSLIFLDRDFSMFLNGFVGRWPPLDFLLYGVTTLNLTKFVPVYALLWGLWFRDRPERELDQDRDRIICVYIAVLFTIVIGRLLQGLMPSRPRPMHEEAIDFRLPEAMSGEILEGWSSFPSDHAAVAFSLATAIMFISIRWGVLAALWGGLVICLTRVYSGLHYLGDIIGGMILGVLVTVVVMNLALRLSAAAPFRQIEMRYPFVFYAGAFILTYLFATLLDDVRKVGEALAILLGF